MFADRAPFAIGRASAIAALGILATAVAATDGRQRSGGAAEASGGNDQMQFSANLPGVVRASGDEGGIAGGVPGACGDTTLTQSTNPVAITAGPFSPACQLGVAPFSTGTNSYARSFLIPPGPNFVVNCVDFGVQNNIGPAYTVTVNIKTGPIGGPYGALTLLGSQSVTIASGAAGIIANANFVGASNAVSVPGGSEMVVEVSAPTRIAAEGGDGGLFLIGSNGAGQSGPSYIRAPGCGVPDFITFASIGFAGVHMVMRVDGGATWWTAISVCNDTGTDAADLHMTFANADGTLFVNPMLVVAPGCPLPVIPNNSLITAEVVIDWGAACVPDDGVVTYIVRSAGGPLTFVSGFWTAAGGAPIGPVSLGCVVMRGLGGGGGGPFPPPVPFWALKVQTRYIQQVVYGVWAKPPGQCWQRWCCFPFGICCQYRVVLCFFPNRVARLFEILGLPNPVFCIRVTGWRKWRFIPPNGLGGPWKLQVQTWKPDPQDPQNPPGGAPPQKPVLFAPNLFDFERAALMPLYSDDNGNTWHVGSDFPSSFFDVFAELPVDSSTSTAPILQFPLLCQAMAPGYMIAAQRLQPLITEMNVVLSQEPSPALQGMKIDTELLQLSLVSCGQQLQIGPPTDPVPFQQGASALFSLAERLATYPDGQPRLMQAAEHCRRMADGMQEMAAQTPGGLQNPIGRDAFLWGHFARLTPACEHFASEMLPHVRIRLNPGAMNNWWPDSIISGVQVVATHPPEPIQLDEQFHRMTHTGDLDVTLMGLRDEPATAVTAGPIRLWIKPPSHLAKEVFVLGNDGESVGPLAMTPGDANGDNCVNQADLNMVLADQGLGGEFALVVPSSDVNFDGLVNIDDIIVVTDNFGLCGVLRADCNQNLVEDALDIANATSLDCNLDGVPDECQGFCDGDTDNNGVVDVDDLVTVILGWGLCVNPANCPADVTPGCGNGVVDVDDLIEVILNWSACNPPD